METRYSRHTSPQFNQPLTREGLKIFHVCRDPLTAREIAERTGFSTETVNERLAALLSQGVLTTSGTAEIGIPAPQPTPETPVAPTVVAELPQDPGADRLEALKRDLLGTLEPKLGRASAALEALEAAENVAALEATARRLVVKLKLTVDRKTGMAFEQQVTELFGVA